MPVNNSAFATLRSWLRGIGLDDLSDWAYQRFVEGKTRDEVMIEIEDQPSFKRKYAAIFDRRAKGLPPVSIDEINEYRRQASNLEHFYDLPSGMISDDAHVNSAMTSDISFNELQTRVQRGAMMAHNQPPEVQAWLKENYGVGEGSMIAFFTDPQHAMPYIERVAQSAVLAGTAARQDFGALTKDEADRLAQSGVTADQAQQAFGELGRSKELFDPLAGTVEDAIGRDTQLGVVEGQSAALERLQRRARERVAAGKGGGSFAGKGLVTGTDRG